MSNADAVDLRVLADVRKKAGPRKPVKSPSDVGGYPNIEPGTPCVDRNHDGMPDEWEKRYGFESNSAFDGPADADGDGYTNVEEYLNGTDPHRKHLPEAS